ncbi:MAG: hypothetical protein JXQ66_00330 [Campylobacterales bacterium]|nr:hypothetical protein [Campylobacterales bacterium]
MQKMVNQTKDGVKISFFGEVKKESILSMVQNCSSGACECMSQDTKNKIKNMEVSGDDGCVELSLSGDITKDEIQEALNRSKVIS